ncbi:hypothetical protein AVEN_254103-1 [Araneus ventricosus]|uniref:Uncharacterized protein n=1 Tax=Araneus ventricosus TaxID=182803 RepID=A0A4Y2BZW2_ARAVE|nr:hypothetical protein AVEN_254103-1 [Araneus ventricosus]
MPGTGNYLPLLGSVVGGAVGTRIFIFLWMGRRKVYPFSGHSSEISFDSFFILKICSDNETFHNVSPFYVAKALSASVGEVKTTRKLRSGDLVVEVSSPKQAKQIIKLKSLSSITISVHPHGTLNSSKGVISVGELFNDTVEHILEELRPQSVKQRSGHSKPNCLGTLTCARCAVAGHESNDSTAKEKCANCKVDHSSFSRFCPSWKIEKEVDTLKFKNNISYPEARNLVKARISPADTSYASVLKQPLVSNETQTIETLICARCSAAGHDIQINLATLSTDTDSDLIASPIKGKYPTRKNNKALTLKCAKQGTMRQDLQSALAFKKSRTLGKLKVNPATKDLLPPPLFCNPSHSSKLLQIHPCEEDDDLQTNLCLSFPLPMNWK